jgi:hypothetical protein
MEGWKAEGFERRGVCTLERLNVGTLGTFEGLYVWRVNYPAASCGALESGKIVMGLRGSQSGFAPATKYALWSDLLVDRFSRICHSLSLHFDQ